MNGTKLINPGKWYTEFDEHGNCTKAVYDVSYRRILGFESEDDYANEQDSWVGSIHPEDKERVDLHLEDCLSLHPEGMDYDIEYRMMTKSGYRLFHDYGHCTRREDGSVSRCDGVVYDIQVMQDKLDEASRNNKLLDAIVQHYATVYVVNMAEDTYNVIKGKKDIHTRFAGDSFSGAMKKYIAGDVVEADRAMLLEETDYTRIRERTEKENSYTVIYRAAVGNEIRWHEMSVTFVGQLESVIIGMKAKDTEILLDMARNSLLNKYYGLYIVELNSNNMKILKGTGGFEKYEGKIIPWRETMLMFSENLQGEDKVFFRDVYGNPEATRAMLHKDKDIEYFYRSPNYGGGYVWMKSEVHIISYDNNGEPELAMVGISSVDSQQREKMHMNELIAEQKQALENQQQQLKKTLQEVQEVNTRIEEQNVVTNYFLIPFVSAYYIGLKDKSCRILKRTEELDNDYPIVTDFETSFEEYISNAVHPDDRSDLRRVVSREFMLDRLAREKEYSHTFRCYAGGEERVYRLNVIRGADENHAAFGFIDITDELREKEEQQTRLQEALAMAQSANRAKTTFLNSMSHDIRTPMNAIIGYTGLAASHIDNKTQVQDYLGKIAQSSEHLLSLINDVLDMSRIESGKMNLNEKGENLPDIIHTLRDIVQADIHSKQHDFFIDTVNVNDDDIICDKLRLNQVLLNILSNSIKYTAPGGVISMRIIEKTVNPNGYATYEFRIKDNGMGMDREFVKTIFDPFTRVRSSTVSGIQGTGLGMAITKNIIDMMGGKIDIQSEPGKGTETVVTFDFKLQNGHREAVVIPEVQGIRALVVDDDTNTCLSVSGMLNDIGMRYEWCVSGKEAVIRAEAAYSMADPFKVYIIDWLMPDMNGIETVRRIRKVIGEDTPIIILTSYDWSDIEAEAREAGVTAFVNKPMFPSDLHQVLSRLLGKTETEPKAEAKAYGFEGKKLLLVEDNEMNREIAEEILREVGFIIDTAEDGAIAVEKIRTASPGAYDIILMDVQMPKMDGYEATRRIRAMGTVLSNIPIIAMTANAFEEDRKAALEAGMNEHIAKPIDVEKLKVMLARFL